MVEEGCPPCFHAFFLPILFECVFLSVADLYDDHALPATAAQSFLCKAARKRKEVRSCIRSEHIYMHNINPTTTKQDRFTEHDRFNR